MLRYRSTFPFLMLAALASGAFAQTPGAFVNPLGPRPSLFFRESFKQWPDGQEHPATQERIASPNLELKVYGPSAKDLQVNGKAGDENNPVRLWTGLCTSPIAATLVDKGNYADLSGLARIRFSGKTSGFHVVRPLIKLADGTWLVGDYEHSSNDDYLSKEFQVAQVRWRKLDINRIVTTGDWANHPDLTKVDEIGFADLMPGSGHNPGGWVAVTGIEVYAKSVPRTAASASR